MRRGQNPLLIPPIGYAIDSAGHLGDIAVCDGHYAATGDALTRPVLWTTCSNVVDLVRAILDEMPIDDGPDAMRFISLMTSRSWRQQLLYPAQVEFLQAVAASQWVTHHQVSPLAPDDFHRQARKAYAVIATIDTRQWGCFLLRKGVLPDPTAVPQLASSGLFPD